MKNHYILMDGQVVPRESWKPDPEDWIESVGSLIYTQFLASGNRIPFLAESLAILGERFRSLGWQLPFSLTYEELKPRLEKLLNKNRGFKGSFIHLAIQPVITPGGFDGPVQFNYVAVTEEREVDYYTLNSKGLSIGISPTFRNTGDPYYSSMVRSQIRTLVLREECLTNGWDEILLTDHNGFLSETSSANLFLRFGNQVVTPGLPNRCFPRLMTRVVSQIIPGLGYQFAEKHTLKPEDLKLAEELFLTDDHHGIRWVLSFENKRYYRKLSALLCDEIQTLIHRTDQFHFGSSG